MQEFLHVKPGKGSAFVRSKLKNLQTGNTLDKTWKAGESFPDAQVDKTEMMYSYIDGDDHVFMNMETFEEERITSKDIDKREFLKEESTINVLFWGSHSAQFAAAATAQCPLTAPGTVCSSSGALLARPGDRRAGA